jgi:hypothetical protein
MGSRAKPSLVARGDMVPCFAFLMSCVMDLGIIGPLHKESRKTLQSSQCANRWFRLCMSSPIQSLHCIHVSFCLLADNRAIFRGILREEWCQV